MDLLIRIQIILNPYRDKILNATNYFQLKNNCGIMEMIVECYYTQKPLYINTQNVWFSILDQILLITENIPDKNHQINIKNYNVKGYRANVQSRGLDDIYIIGTSRDWDELNKNLNNVLDFQQQLPHLNLIKWHDDIKIFISEIMHATRGKANQNYWKQFIWESRSFLFDKRRLMGHAMVFNRFVVENSRLVEIKNNILDLELICK